MKKRAESYIICHAASAYERHHYPGHLRAGVQSLDADITQPQSVLPLAQADVSA